MNLNIPSSILLQLQLYILIFCILIGKVHAQNFAPQGATWHYEYSSFFETGFVEIISIGDSIIESDTCQTLIKNRIVYDYINLEIDTVPLGLELFLSDEDQLMVLRNGMFYLLFNFEAEIGDSWLIPYTYDVGCDTLGTLEVTGKGIETINEMELRYIDVVSPEFSEWVYSDDTVRIFERIGPIDAYLLPNQRCVTDVYEGGALRCYSDSVFGEYQSTELPCDFITSIETHTLGVNFQIFPNPTSHNTQIEWDRAIQVKSISIVNLSGSRIYHRDNLAKSSSAINIDVHGFSPGMYFVELITGEGERTSKKLIIE